MESKSSPQATAEVWTDRCPHMTLWVKEYGQIELGYDYNTDTCARALDEGGMVWSGGDAQETVDAWLLALDMGISEFMKEQGFL